MPRTVLSILQAVLVCRRKSIKKPFFFRRLRARGMRGVGGPLLTIGDLLGDLGEESESDLTKFTGPESSCSLQINQMRDPLDLCRLFEEKFDELNKAIASSDPSWTALTLELCTALETANKLIHSTDSNVKMMLEKVAELERIIKRGDSAVTAAKAISFSVNKPEFSAGKS